MTERELSFCLDVGVGYNEKYREELIDFLRKDPGPFQIGRLERGMWQDVKLLRIHTTQAEGLMHHVMEGLRNGDDYDYTTYFYEIEAGRADEWLPDFDTEHGCEPFTLDSSPTT